MSSALRLALGTLTVLPVRPPRVVDRQVAGWAMTFAPLVGALLAVAVAGFAGLLEALAVPRLLVAVLAVAVLAALTRAIHLDGLADTADGLGSGRPADAALEVMRRGDTGPFGVATLVLVLLLQVAALAELVDGRAGLLTVGVAVVASRLLVPLLCVQGVPAARTGGLGHLVVGSVGPAQLVLACAAAFLLAVLGFATAGGSATGADLTAAAGAAGAAGVTGVVVAVVAALAAGMTLGLWCVRRLGGVSGDVLGACVEVSFTAAVVTAAVFTTTVVTTAAP